MHFKLCGFVFNGRREKSTLFNILSKILFEKNRSNCEIFAAINFL